MRQKGYAFERLRLVRGAAKDFGPHEKNLDRAPNTTENFFTIIFIKSCFYCTVF